MGHAPRVYIIGAMKAGTTSLAHMLGQHPDIEVSTPKEPDYFTANLAKGPAWYAGCFKEDAGKIRIDASTSYTKAAVAGVVYPSPHAERLGGVPRRIHDFSPDAKLIYILREPVSRTYSAYNHEYRAGRERLPFREALARQPQYLCTSNYLEQLRLYLEVFPREAIRVVLFEDFKADPVGIARECLEFIGADPDVELGLERAVNTGYRYNVLGELLRRTNIIEPLSRLLPYAVKSRLAALVQRPIPRMSEDDKRFLIEHFAPLNARLAEELGIDLSCWKRA